MSLTLYRLSVRCPYCDEAKRGMTQDEHDETMIGQLEDLMREHVAEAHPEAQYQNQTRESVNKVSENG